MEILGASPIQQVVMLYTHILVNLRHARTDLEAGNIEGRTDHLDKAQECINELLGMLAPERGGEVARNLASLYAWMLSELIDINIRNDGRGLDRVITMVDELHSAWHQVQTSNSPQELSA